MLSVQDGSEISLFPLYFEITCFVVFVTDPDPVFPDPDPENPYKFIFVIHGENHAVLVQH